MMMASPAHHPFLAHFYVIHLVPVSVLTLHEWLIEASSCTSRKPATWINFKGNYPLWRSCGAQTSVRMTHTMLTQQVEALKIQSAIEVAGMECLQMCWHSCTPLPLVLKLYFWWLWYKYTYVCTHFASPSGVVYTLAQVVWSFSCHLFRVYYNVHLNHLLTILASYVRTHVDWWLCRWMV